MSPGRKTEVQGDVANAHEFVYQAGYEIVSRPVRTFALQLNPRVDIQAQKSACLRLRDFSCIL